MKRQVTITCRFCNRVSYMTISGGALEYCQPCENEGLGKIYNVDVETIAEVKE